jgi:hypothetical protein
MFRCWGGEDYAIHVCLQPIFLLLPLLEASASHFTGQEQLLSENPQFHALRGCANLNLGLVCEVKQAGDEEYFKLSPPKLEAWLKSRVARVQAVLNSRRIAGSHLVRLLIYLNCAHFLCWLFCFVFGSRRWW